ncbi:hypothetical protein AVEN_191967-1 [Araneus ventricosus]|uniref:Uncharacterized protein n=1 Tax=Araneus ventricosus TaxID=182803 RepID=A0A4Y2L7N4_ARAVE|nr:hypothetical protein AVEN_191967-1 [Araneus ventricosus]
MTGIHSGNQYGAVLRRKILHSSVMKPIWRHEWFLCERNRHLIFHVSPQCLKSSRGQAEEQKSHIRELDRIYRADGRANETAEETERRRSEDRFRIIARRNNMSAEETEELLSDDQLRANGRRNNESFELRNQHQASDHLRTLNSRTTESNE